MTITANPAQIDLRPLAPPERHRLIFATLATLAIGESLELTNDHDPQPLFRRMEIELPGSFGWRYLEQGAQTWRVAITRLAAAPAPARSGCCGSCGGG